MTVTSVHKDPEARTMTITAELDASVDRVWQLWADARQLERWWFPPTHRATVVDYDLAPGGKVSYFMIGPEGDRTPGWWRVLAVEAPHRLEFELSDPDPGIPTMTIRVSLEERTGGGTRMTIETTFPSIEAMDQLLSMGIEQGMSTAIGQIADVL